MTDWQGSLRKMQTELTETVRYTVFPDQGGLCLNDWLGQSISLSFTGTIQCVACDRMTKKSFNQGYCFPCFRKLAACDQLHCQSREMPFGRGNLPRARLGGNPLSGTAHRLPGEYVQCESGYYAGDAVANPVD